MVSDTPYIHVIVFSAIYNSAVLLSDARVSLNQSLVPQLLSAANGITETAEALQECVVPINYIVV